MKTGLREWAERDPTRIAAAMGARTLTYAALEQEANRLAHVLRACGLVRGDHVAAMIGNDPWIFALVWASYRAGVYFTPISTASSAADAAHIVGDSTARLAILDGRLPEAAAVARLPGVAGARLLGFAAPIAGLDPIEALTAAAPTTPIADETPGALMLYTSGTTSAPKGVWRPLPESGAGPPPFARDLLELFTPPPGARYLSTAPLYHAAPLRFSLAFITAGATVQIMERFDAETALDLLEREAITHSQWVPTMFQRLLALPAGRRARHRAPAHVLALHAAAPCPVHIKRAMIDWWGDIIHEYYGGSEGIGFCDLSAVEWLQHPGSVGRARRGTIHILDERARPLPAGQTGRIFFSGTPAFEYFGAPEKTRLKVSPQGFRTFGDIGHVDDEGYLYLTDRLDDMIISGGVNLYPQEIEGALLEMPGVADCAVIGVEDPEFGERAVAFVVPAPTHTDATALVAALHAGCRERLGRVKRPKDIQLVAELPRTPTGKLLRRALRQNPTGSR